MENSKINQFSKQLNHPDERRDFKAHGHFDLVNFEDGTNVGRGIFEPGWRWSEDVKPIAGTPTCEVAHLGYCVKGSMVIRMTNGEEFRISAGDAFRIPPGHDAWVDGIEACELLDVGGRSTDYAMKKSSEKKAA